MNIGFLIVVALVVIAISSSVRRGRHGVAAACCGIHLFDGDEESTRDRMADLADEYDHRLHELEARYEHRIVELEERVDFAERLLSQHTGERKQLIG